MNDERAVEGLEHLQNAALETWRGQEVNARTGQQAFYEWARRNGAACLGNFTEEPMAA